MNKDPLKMIEGLIGHIESVNQKLGEEQLPNHDPGELWK